MTDTPMIALNPDIPRNRAVFAFHTLFGGPAKSEFFGLAIPASIRLADFNLIAAVGDTDKPLSFMALRPLAIEQGCDVIATWLASLTNLRLAEVSDRGWMPCGSATFQRGFGSWLPARCLAGGWCPFPLIGR